MGSRTGRMRQVLQNGLNAVYLDLVNESHMHNVPKDAETHFKVIVVSPLFDGMPLVKRHQKVQELLKEELDTGLHALSIVAKTSAEFAKLKHADPYEPSPPCRGGFGK